MLHNSLVRDFGRILKCRLLTVYFANYLGEPPTSYSSLWKGYTVLGEDRAKLFSSYSTAAVVSFRYRSGMESVRVPLLWVCMYIQYVCVCMYVCELGLAQIFEYSD